MDTTNHNNKLSSAAQKMNISYCTMPKFKKSRRSTRCSAFLLSVLLSILQTIIAIRRRMRIPYPRGDCALSLFAFRLILYQKDRRRRKRGTVGLKSPPRLYRKQLNQFIMFSPKGAVEDTLCCKNDERWCLC